MCPSLRVFGLPVARSRPALRLRLGMYKACAECTPVLPFAIVARDAFKHRASLSIASVPSSATTQPRVKLRARPTKRWRETQHCFRLLNRDRALSPGFVTLSSSCETLQQSLQDACALQRTSAILPIRVIHSHGHDATLHNAMCSPPGAIVRLSCTLAQFNCSPDWCLTSLQL